MDHQSFRYYIPGIVFLLPIYAVACWITVTNYTNSDIRVFVLLGGITTFPVIALPVGWWIYNTYRVWWLILTKGGYENKDFVKLICKDTKPFYSPYNQSILIDFSYIKNIGSWIKFDLDIFRRTFYPFTSNTAFEKEIQQKGIRPKFMEPLSDYILFQENGYDYARSISTVRYGLESSIFALLLSSLYAFGLRVIWQYQLHLTTNKVTYFTWVSLVVFLSVCIIITLFIRWKEADREYDARLLLTTSTSLKSNYFNIDLFKKNIPKDIIEKINNLNLSNRPYAAFDLDNTLLIGDIGEAVFASMVNSKTIQNFDWTNYLRLIEENREAAYKKIIELMNGLNLSVLKKVTNEIINSLDKNIEIGDDKILLPKPNPIMQSIVSLLMTKGINVYVVTASNKISAEIICWKYFGIPASNVLGASFEINKSNRIIYHKTDIPYAEGKVTILEKQIKGRPIITAGDGIWDKYLLDYTKLEGIRLWLGKNKNEYQRIKDNYYKDLQFYHIELDKR
jgi:phosphoserine phosphatase